MDLSGRDLFVYHFRGGSDWGCCGGNRCVSCDIQKNGKSISSTLYQDSWCFPVS
jgi:hypothetical protein